MGPKANRSECALYAQPICMSVILPPDYTADMEMRRSQTVRTLTLLAQPRRAHFIFDLGYEILHVVMSVLKSIMYTLWAGPVPAATSLVSSSLNMVLPRGHDTDSTTMILK
ncbi:hypothetical protein AcW1_008118 [Taiwanofungus camphoratus]|nr:hypothetical protein AcW1_008118 [Antrodia cinnamomea]